MSKRQTFVVFTQNLENYGAHTPEQSGGFYWKPKGGKTYIVSHCYREYDATAAVSLACMQEGATLGLIETVVKAIPLSEWDPSDEDMHEHTKEFGHINVETHFQGWAELVCRTHNMRLTCKHCDRDAAEFAAEAKQSAE